MRTPPTRTKSRTRRLARSLLLRGLASRLGLCVFGASLTVAVALILLALGGLHSFGLAGQPELASQLTRWVWTTGLSVVAATSGVCYALAVWRLAPLLDLAEGSRRLASGEASIRVRETDAVGEVRALAHAFNHMAARLDESYQELDRRHRDLTRANVALEQLSATDGLTGLFNHRHFQNHLLREAARAERTLTPLCLVLVDVDDFKQLNDSLGHSVGDRVLQEIAGAMRGQIRGADYLARYGGEEFVLLLPQTGVEGGLALAEKVRGAVEALDIPVPGEDCVQVTVSIGLAAYDASPEATFEAADRALYEAKAAGKNRAVVAEASEPTRL